VYKRNLARLLAVSVAVLILGCSNSADKDTEAPLITLVGDNPLVVYHGDIFVDPGANVSDNVDKNLYATVSGTVDTSTLGAYTLSYDVTDSLGNHATTVTRVVNVVARQGTITGTAISGLSYTTDTLSGVTSEDGTFNYLAGEEIQFFVGDIMVGDTVVAADSLTVLDLVDGAQIFTTVGELSRLLNLPSEQASLNAFNRFHNTLVFLQTLDKDKDPTNGISIDEGWTQLFDGLQIDFEEHAEHFAGGWGRRQGLGNRVLRLASYRAFNQGLTDNAMIAPHGVVLDYYYSVHGIEHNFFSHETISEDAGADFVIDEILSLKYDQFGNQIEYAYDYDADGVNDDISVSVYDENQSRLSISTDSNADGQYEYSYSEEYNSHRNKVAYYNDTDGDGVIDSTGRFIYDELGNNTGVEYDTDANGVLDFTYNYTYDERGNRIASAYDYDGDGIIDVGDYATFDSQDNILSYSSDNDGDGVIDIIEHHTYDAAGNRISTTIDRDADGIQDEFYFSTYDEAGNRTLYQADIDGDGTVDHEQITQFGPFGGVIYRSSDNDGDGQPDFTYTIDRNEYGVTTHVTYDWDGDGINDQSNSYVVDSNGNVVMSSGDDDGDGVVDRFQTTTYDDYGNMVRFELDSDGDGQLDTIWTFTSVKTTARAAIEDVL